ncbi:hypothetical protein F8E02_03670 [Methanoculleus sp. Wushi-C6]|uniref:PGF-CTERM sorting domain-containing protein n=1 Tax=Methanoculleus caldifontis TaxID=2651577 RepID=A0ABU3WZ97_9EURY|nr:hypothetical protein [Methanoculleus sp. Wushi-C6]MDV2481122.1 hypothetical protein [Methanoculleus sp. Wushi-C6]
MDARRSARILAALVLAAWVCGTAAAQGTTIDEIGTVAAGETVVISGTTNLAPGNRLIVEVTPVAFGPGGAGGTSGTAVVQAGNGTANTWSFEVNTAGFEPGEYLVTVDWVEGDATTSSRFTVTAPAATPTPTATPTPEATPTPTPEPSPTPTAAGPVMPAAAALAAAAAGLLVRRR